MQPPLSILGAALLLGARGSAVTIDWTFVGNPGNACDPQTDIFGGAVCFGAVEYAYNIGTYEVTNAQYAEFLNAKAATDTYSLYNTNMGDPSTGFGQRSERGRAHGLQPAPSHAAARRERQVYSGDEAAGLDPGGRT